MDETVYAFTNKNNTYPFMYTDMDKFMEGIPDKITATAKCSDLDEFNAETGCALARTRVLEKLYRYRCKVMDRVSDYYQNLSYMANEVSYRYDLRAEDYSDIIDTTINETFGI